MKKENLKYLFMCWGVVMCLICCIGCIPACCTERLQRHIIILFFCVSTTQHQWNQAISLYYLRCHILWTGKAITGPDWACGGCICTKSKCCQEDEIISLTVTPHTWPILRPQGHTGDLVTGLPLTLYPQSCTASSVSHTQLVRAMQSDVGGRQPVDMEHNKQM